MTAVEMQLRFNQKLQNHITFKLDIRTIDIEYFLNVSQDNYIDKLFVESSDQEFFKKRVGALYESESITLLPAGTKPNSFVAALPDECKYVLESEHVVTSTGDWIRIKPIDRKYYTSNIQNPFLSPYAELGWRLDAGGRTHELILMEGMIPVTYEFDYLKIPTAINIKNNISSDIHAEFHDEIVENAIRVALEIYARTGTFRAPEDKVPQE